MIIDMHMHTQKHSSCAKITLVEILNNLSGKIRAIVLTEHDHFHEGDLQPLENKYDIHIFLGAEITSLEGHILAYGISSPPSPNRAASIIIDEIHRQGGVAIASHPFRHYGVANAIHDLPFDGVEINGTATSVENQRAREVANMYSLPLIGGSDTHFISDMNTQATRFPMTINSISDIVNCIKNRQCSVVRI